MFTISPEKAVIESKASTTFTISGMAYVPADVSEQLVCTASVVNSNKTSRTAFDFTAHALVATPLLDFSERSLVFK